MPLPRASGILLHPTSFPGPYGIGDLGPAAYRWVDFLARAGQQLWQILPLGPTGYGDSPYQCFSAFAGNVFLISPERLMGDGLLRRADVEPVPDFPLDRVDYGPVIQYQWHLLRRANARFKAGNGDHLHPEFRRFARQHAAWLNDFALFMALKDSHGGAVWSDWEPELVARKPRALSRARKALADEIEAHKFWQFLFYRQWKALKEYANGVGLRIVGDIPIFVAYDSSDVWANPDLFHLDEHGKPTLVAGVPPDYFSVTGQLWGNPLYRWQAHQETGYAWWIERFRATLRFVDVVRLDHFRGFEAYWEIPFGMPTAEVGRWVKGPAHDFFNALRDALGGDLPIIAEDLGVVTPEMLELRDAFGLPGMKVLQFAFGGDPREPFLPHNYPHNCVVYTGTHDNDTTRGWYASAPERERDYARRYLARDGHDIAWDLIRLGWGSVADQALAPLQDVLSLGTEARMNYPGRPAGNWGWRYRDDALTERIRLGLLELTTLYGRAARQVETNRK